MTRYLSVEDLVTIHTEMLARFGGTKGVRDPNALSSAVSRPQSGYYADIIEEAAALFESCLKITRLWMETSAPPSLQLECL